MDEEPDDGWIPLLSGKGLCDFTPSEFLQHVRSLKMEKTKKPSAPFTFRVNKKGSLCLRFNRLPKYLTPAEIDQIVKETGLDLITVCAKITAKKSGIEIKVEEKLT